MMLLSQPCLRHNRDPAECFFGECKQQIRERIDQMQFLKSRTVIMLAMSAIFIGSAPAATSAKKNIVPTVDSTAATELVSVFRKIESKVSVGISFSRYKEELPGLNFAVKEFADSEFAKQVPLAVTAYQDAERRYRYAALVWDTHTALSPNLKYVPEAVQQIAQFCPKQQLLLEKMPERALEPCLSDIWAQALEFSEEGRKIINDAKSGKTKR
jgi:hypothetical protein